MKNCPSCGAPLADNDTFCGNCGAKTAVSEKITFEDPIRGFNPDRIEEPVVGMQAQVMPQMQAQNMPQIQNPQQMMNPNGQPAGFDPSQQMYQQPFYGPHPQAGLVTAIKVFLIISCVGAAAFFFIPLAWRLPMTIIAFKKMDSRQPMGLAFKICSLLFVGFIPGILMLALNDDMPNFGYRY